MCRQKKLIVYTIYGLIKGLNFYINNFFLFLQCQQMFVPISMQTHVMSAFQFLTVHGAMIQ